MPCAKPTCALPWLQEKQSQLSRPNECLTRKATQAPVALSRLKLVMVTNTNASDVVMDAGRVFFGPNHPTRSSR